MRLVDHGLGERPVQRPVALPVVRREVDDHALHRPQVVVPGRARRLPASAGSRRARRRRARTGRAGSGRRRTAGRAPAPTGRGPGSRRPARRRCPARTRASRARPMPIGRPGRRPAPGRRRPRGRTAAARRRRALRVHGHVHAVGRERRADRVARARAARARAARVGWTTACIGGAWSCSGRLEADARLHHPAVDDVGRRGAVATPRPRRGTRRGWRSRRARRRGRAGSRSRAWPARPDPPASPRRSACGRRPGATPTTVIPCGASSTPAVRVSIRTPPLAAQYGELPGIGQSSWIEEMLMIRPPPPCLIICFAASWTPKNALLRSIAITRSNWCSVVSSVEVRVSMPALLTMMSSRPNARDGLVDEVLDVRDRRDVALDGLGLAAGGLDLLDRRVGRGLVLVVVDRHRRALARRARG